MYMLIFDMTLSFFFLIHFLRKIIERIWNQDEFYIWHKISYQMVCHYSNPFSEAASLRVYVTSLPKSLDLTDKVIRDNISIFIPKCRLRYRIFEIFLLCLKTIWFFPLPLMAWQFTWYKWKKSYKLKLISFEWN